MDIMNGKEKTNQKFLIILQKKTMKLCFLAGIHQNNQFCIITREATETISTIHHRELP